MYTVFYKGEIFYQSASRGIAYCIYRKSGCIKNILNELSYSKFLCLVSMVQALQWAYNELDIIKV